MARFTDLCMVGVEDTYNTEQTTLAPLFTLKDIQFDPDSEAKPQREHDRATPGNFQFLNDGWEHGTLSMSTEFNAAAAKGDAPHWSVLARAAGLAETLTAGAKAVYNPILEDDESLTAHVYNNKNIHKLTGLRGGLSWGFQIGQIPKLSWSGMGFRAGFGNQVPPGTAAEAGQPRTLRKTETLLTFGGQNVCVVSASGSMNTVVDYTRSTCDRVIVGDHRPSMSIVIEAPDFATKNWFLDSINIAVEEMIFSWGIAGNQMRLRAPKASLGKVTPGKGNNIHQLTLEFACMPDTGYDALLIETGDFS